MTCGGYDPDDPKSAGWVDRITDAGDDLRDEIER